MQNLTFDKFFLKFLPAYILPVHQKTYKMLGKKIFLRDGHLETEKSDFSKNNNNNLWF